MSLIQNNLRSYVLRCTTNCEGSSLVEHFGETEVCQFEVAVVGDQQVLGFKVAEDYVLLVQVLEAEGYGGGVEAGLLGCEGLYRTQVCEELAAVY